MHFKKFFFWILPHKKLSGSLSSESLFFHMWYSDIRQNWKGRNRIYFFLIFFWQWFKRNSSKMKYVRNVLHTTVNPNSHLLTHLKMCCYIYMTSMAVSTILYLQNLLGNWYVLYVITIVFIGKTYYLDPARLKAIRLGCPLSPFKKCPNRMCIWIQIVDKWCSYNKAHRIRYH